MKASKPFARLVLAPAHKAFVLQAKAHAKARIVVTSHRLSIAARQAVFIPLARSAAIQTAESVQTLLFYGREPSQGAGLQTDHDWAGHEWSQFAAQLSPSLHAKCSDGTPMTW